MRAAHRGERDTGTQVGSRPATFYEIVARKLGASVTRARLSRWEEAGFGQENADVGEVVAVVLVAARQLDVTRARGQFV
jgi:hypothetical protein